MKNLLAILAFAMFLGGCARGANLMVPKLPGPADSVHCVTERVDGNNEGTYNCTIKGRYVMEGFGLF